jgi:hypothetical protein
MISVLAQRLPQPFSPIAKGEVDRHMCNVDAAENEILASRDFDL